MNTLLTIAIAAAALLFGTITIQLAGVVVLTAVTLIEAHLFLTGRNRESFHWLKMWQLPKLKIAFAVAIG